MRPRLITFPGPRSPKSTFLRENLPDHDHAAKVDTLHRYGIAVFMDFVGAHFAKAPGPCRRFFKTWHPCKMNLAVPGGYRDIMGAPALLFIQGSYGFCGAAVFEEFFSLYNCFCSL